MPDITHAMHVVDRLPFGAAVLRVDEVGTIHTYFSREASLDDIARDLAMIATAQMEHYCRKPDSVAV